MFSWIPRWHPFIWAAVIIVGVLIWQDPVGAGHTVRSWINSIPGIADHISLFFRSI